MIFNLWTNYGALNSKPIFDAFANGAKKLGHQVFYNSGTGIDVIWSMLWNGRMRPNQQIYLNAIRNKKPILILEIGAINRGITWKVGINGINRAAYFGPDNNPYDRRKKLNLKLSPWQENNGAILIACQHKLSGQWEDPSQMENWLHKSIKKIRSYTNRDIIVRPHPRCPINEKKINASRVFIQTPQKIKNTYDDYNLDLKNFFAVVNWSSNPGIHAAIEGIPIFVGPNSLAYTVGNHSFKTLNSPIKPCREQWLNDLAYTEWTTNEISTGEPLNRLMLFLKDSII